MREMKSIVFIFKNERNEKYCVYFQKWEKW